MLNTVVVKKLTAKKVLEYSFQDFLSCKFFYNHRIEHNSRLKVYDIFMHITNNDLKV